MCHKENVKIPISMLMPSVLLIAGMFNGTFDSFVRLPFVRELSMANN